MEGKAEGNFITLDRAMHATNIAKRAKGNTPVSCVSCHEQQTKERRECAGCHKIVTPSRSQAWCATCHNVTPSMTPADLQQGIADKLPPERNEELAAETVLSHKPPSKNLAPTDAPTRSPSTPSPKLMSHPPCSPIVGTFPRSWNASRTTSWPRRSYNQPEILCSTCHHRSPLSATPPKCASCHTKDIDPAHPQRPSLKAAYHLQCMGCHQGMNVGRQKRKLQLTHKARP